MIINPSIQSLIIPIFVIFGLSLFTFVFWRDSTREGFNSDKIFDTSVLAVILGFLGGKLLFRPLDLNYIRYEIITSPLILEGLLAGGFIAIYFQVKRNGWEGNKIGDMVAPALSLFQATMFLGIFLATSNYQNLLLFLSFAALYIFVRFLKLNVNLGRSAKYFERMRLNKIVLTGGLLAAYLFFSSLIAVCFLLYNTNVVYWFWWFQLLFYLVIFLASIFYTRSLADRAFFMNKEGFKSYFSNKLNLINYLKNKKKQIRMDEAVLRKENKSISDPNVAGGVQNAESGDDVMVKNVSDEINRSKQILGEQKQEINETLDRINDGTYGMCNRCGKRIGKDRLNAYPYAKYCIDCQTIIDEKSN